MVLSSRRRTGLAATAAAGALALALSSGAGGGALAAAPAPATVPLSLDAKLRQVQGFTPPGTSDALTAAEQFAQARQAPGLVSPGAYDAAFAEQERLRSRPGTWTESTDVPYDSDDLRYRDPSGNATGGLGVVSGRVVALAASPDGQTLYAGAANGGVFRSGDQGARWVPISDDLPSLSVGDVKTAPDGAIWLATGEANTGGTSYAGSGVYRLEQRGSGKARGAGAVFRTKDRVGDVRSARGGNPLSGATINDLHFDGAGSVYASTSRGVWKARDDGRGTWTQVLITNPGALTDTTSSNAPYANLAHGVVTRPGQPQTVLAAYGWRSSTDNAYYGNGFYVSEQGGRAGTFTKVDPVGIPAEEIGNTSFAYSADGSVLYAVVQSTRLINTPGAASVLGGVYSSTSGPRGPWTLIADSRELEGGGSALSEANIGAGYQPGVQAWYNQFLAVDPADPQHVYLGLEEVYETRDGGTTWNAVGPYWNFAFDCWSVDPAENTCPLTTHPDQHDVLFAGGTVFVGNDGGVYSRAAASRALNDNGNATDWRSLNAGLRSLQYYSAAAGVDTELGGVVLSGGLQDNGGSVLRGLRPDGTTADPGDGTSFPAGQPTGTMGSNFGGDGGDVIVDPADGCRVVGEYVFLALRKTVTPCGQSDGTTPGTVDIAPLDAAPRFIAPIEADSTNSDHWFAGGNSIWFNPVGFDIEDGDGWQEVAQLGSNQGALNSTTALASADDVVYAGYCAPCNNLGFANGLTRAEPDGSGGFTATEVAATGLPNRFLSGIWVDPEDTDHVLVAVNGFSRRFTEGPGAGIGHLFESVDGGESFTDISGSLPDVPANDVVVVDDEIIVATDLGVVVAGRERPGKGLVWRNLGANLPAVTVLDLSVGPDGVLYAATHSRGIWGIEL